jgi:hypothetical protein
MDNLIDPINHLKGYVDLSGITLNVSFADFGLSALRDGIRGRDAESVIKNLHTVITNIEKFKEPLTAEGLSESLIARFVAARSSVAADKQKQYEILINRKNIVQTNLGSLNELYDQLCEILKIGKILYKQTDPVKLKEYTFTELMKQVRKTVKNNDEGTTGDSADGKTPEIK